MAVKNHALDDRLVEAARAEFLEKGFRGASLSRITQRAGLTTGALYTRYKNKDALFCSLVQEVLELAGRHMAGMYQAYSEAQASGDPRQLLNVIRQEESLYLDMLVEHKEACVLLFCRSDGSSLETHLKEMMDRKAEQTEAYFKSIAKPGAEVEGLGFIISSQFHFFRQILEKNYEVDKTLRCMKTVTRYMEAGWTALFEEIL